MNSTATSPSVPSRAGLHEWFSCPPGSLLLRAEVAEIHRMLGDLFGYHLLQVGHLGDADLLSTSRTLYRLLVEVDSRSARANYPAVRGAPTALPVESHSVDVVVLPHVLEFEARPHDALREAFRVLVPEGHLLICGFNPWSLLGVWRALARSGGDAPWCGQFIGINRMKDWLALLGFDLLDVHGRFFQPPFTNERLLRKMQRLDQAGERLLPYFAGVYVLLARKKVLTLTPIRAPWRPRGRLVGVGLAGPSARVARRG